MLAHHSVAFSPTRAVNVVEVKLTFRKPLILLENQL